ncbi:MAG: cytochrome c3 family protein [Bdellovibrionales bacterium]|nr:cytochrome c3 family protein [Bdellovibrionales bacterium]
MLRKFRIFFLVLPVALLAVLFSREERADVLAQTTQSNYPELGLSSGVWNDGQAALWDLSIIDHFKIFGPTERASGHRPEQPINFSHVTHVQKNQIDCQYCHWTVTKSSYAAIPEVETCMGCHMQVPGQTPEQQGEIKKISEYYQGGKGQPIPWVKVHVMPDHVKFNHKRHIKAGVSCQSCHGQVPEMDVVQRVSSMKMGWCVDCHRTQGTSIDCAVCHH